MSQYRLDVTLCQYTPLLHFQGDTEGACLRASEVKPKLDKFVVNYLKQLGIGEEDIPAQWKLSIPGDGDKNPHNTALQYKMRFEGIGKAEETDVHPLYFAGNMTGTAKSIFHENGVRLTIIALKKQCLTGSFRLYNEKTLKNPTLIELLKEMLPAFFALHCFGTRSNKGFGSFVVEGVSVPAAALRRCMPYHCLAIFDLASTADKYGMFERLDDIYVLSAMMKGGINLSFGRTPAYYKGDIQMLLSANHIGSEKAYLKQKVFTEAEKQWYQSLCKRHHNAPDYHQYQFIRAMLGLTDTYTFGIGRNAKKFSVKDVNETITRFANPITFKPYEDGILVLVHSIPDMMLGAEFRFRDSDHTISTPKQFDIVKFTSDFLHQLGGKAQNPYWNSFYKADPSIKIKGRTADRRIYFQDTLKTLYLDEEGGV